MPDVRLPPAQGQEADPATPPPAAPRLNWNDPHAVRTWLAGLRVAWDDADSILQDALRRPRKRDLGPAEHRRLYRDAAAKIEEALTFASPEGIDGDR